MKKLKELYKSKKSVEKLIVSYRINKAFKRPANRAGLSLPAKACRTQ